MEGMQLLNSKSNHPKFMEVFSNMNNDSQVEQEIFDAIRIQTGGKKEKYKNIARDLLGSQSTELLKRIRKK